MSKIIKSQHCVEAHPCLLEPVDVEAFFVNNREDESLNSPNGTDAETAAALEEVLGAIFPQDENQAKERDESAETNLEKQAEDAAENETAVETQEPDLFKLNLEAEKLVDRSKQEADALTQLARGKAESITGAAEEEAMGIREQVLAEAARIKEKAQSHADGVIEKAQQQANEIVNQAKQEAEKTIAQARQQAEELKVKAHEEGLAAGHQEGLAKAKQETAANLKDSLTILSQAEEERINRIASSEAELLKLVAGIVEKIIGAELKTHPEQMASIVREGLSKVATANSITVKINPGDLQLIRDNIPALQEVFDEPKMIGINADQTILPGDCFIETEHGKVDARIKSQLERIMNEILKAGQVNEPG